MTLDEKEHVRLPSHLQALFRKRHNPGAQEVLDLFPESRGQQGDVRGTEPSKPIWGNASHTVPFPARNDSGSAARFYYCAKASKADRAGSNHPTVKPIKLMQWLCRLITPPGGTILDPFSGSGTTGAAAIAEGFRPVLIEREEEYLADIERRFADSDVAPQATISA